MNDHGRQKYYTMAMVFCILLFNSRVSTAESDKDADRFVIGTLLVCGEIITIPYGVAFALNTLVSDSSDELSSVGSQIVGYTAGAMNLGLGIAWIYFYGENEEAAIWLGIANLTIGLIDVGLTIWASSKPKREELRLTLGPMVITDSIGHLAFGVRVKLMEW